MICGTVLTPGTAPPAAQNPHFCTVCSPFLQVSQAPLSGARTAADSYGSSRTTHTHQTHPPDTPTRHTHQTHPPGTPTTLTYQTCLQGVTGTRQPDSVILAKPPSLLMQLLHQLSGDEARHHQQRHTQPARLTRAPACTVTGLQRA